MIIKRKHIRKVGSNNESELSKVTKHDSGPGWSTSSSSESFSSEKVFSDKVNLGGTRVKFEDMTDKQLENLAKGGDISLKKYLKGAGKYLMPTSTISGGSIALGMSIDRGDKFLDTLKKTGKGGLIGAGSGALATLGLSLGGKAYHKKIAKRAQEELDKRNKK